MLRNALAEESNRLCRALSPVRQLTVPRYLPSICVYQILFGVQLVSLLHFLLGFCTNVQREAKTNHLADLM